MEFGENFKKIRKENNLSQRQVAEKLGIYQSNVSDWENDRSRPSYELLIELAKIYDTTLYDLLGIPDDRFWKS